MSSMSPDEPHEFNALSSLSLLHFQSVCKDERKAGKNLPHNVHVFCNRMERGEKNEEPEKCVDRDKNLFPLPFSLVCDSCSMRSAVNAVISRLYLIELLWAPTLKVFKLHFNPMRLVRILTRLDVIIPFQAHMISFSIAARIHWITRQQCRSGTRRLFRCWLC